MFVEGVLVEKLESADWRRSVCRRSSRRVEIKKSRKLQQCP